MRLPPVEVLRSWPDPNYDNPVTRGDALVVVNSIFVALAVITVGLRLYTRIVIKRWFGVDDVLILLALLFTIGLTAVVLLANQKYGWNRHVWDIPFILFEPTLKIAMTAKIVFTAAATFTRLSLHCFYYRLVADSGKEWFKWLVHVNVFYTVGILISFTFIAIFQCDPVPAYWSIIAPKSACMNEGVATLVCGIINCVADLITTLTPMPLVLALQMPRSQRFAVGILFSLGFVVTIAGIVRTWYIYKSLIAEWDQTWYAYPLWIAAAIEIDLGVICASAPVLRPLMAHMPFSLSKIFSSGISLKINTHILRTPIDPSLQGSTVAANSTERSSKRRSDVIRAAPELKIDRGKSYELGKWDDVEREAAIRHSRGGTDKAIVHDECEDVPPTHGLRGFWDRVTASKHRDADQDTDMTITRTSEVELQITTRSGYNSARLSRHPPPPVPPKDAHLRPK